MTQMKRSRPLLLLTIISLFLVVPFATACSEILNALVSTDTAGIVDGIEFGPEDILAYDVEGEEWSLFFDGSQHELQTGKHDIEAFSLPTVYSETLDSDSRTIFISFHQNKVKVNGLGQVMGQDIIKFTETLSPSSSYSYSRYFDGSDVGLSTVGEKIDALDVLDGEFAEFISDDQCPAILSISTLGAYSIPAKFTDGAGRLTGDGSDVLLFCATNLGEDTAGFWFTAFKGKAAGMPKNYIDSLAGSFLDSFFFFTTPGDFVLENAAGGHSEVYVFDSDEFSGPEFSASEHGLDAFVDALHVAHFCDEDCIDEIDD